MATPENTHTDADELLQLREQIYGKSGNPSMFVSGFNYEDDNEGVEGDGDLPKDVRDMLKAAEHGDLDLLATLLAKTPELVNCMDSDQYTPMHRAAYSDKEKVVQLLLDHGGKVDALTESGWQPLHCASCWGCPLSAGVLINKGHADVNAKTHGHVTPLHLAAACTESFEGAMQVAKLLLSHDDIKIDVANDAGDTPEAIAHRSSKLVFQAIQEYKSKKNI